MPFSDQSFEMVSCFEVLEHLPYQLFPIALNELYRVSKEYAAISLPDHTRAYRINIQIPKLGEIKKLVTVPKLFPPKHIFNNQHYWEIGKAGYPVQRIEQDIAASKFNILESYRIFEYPKYHFFVLHKNRE
jgi:ubiquinone/menaquinone biosynthesis C-methylase UbiE